MLNETTEDAKLNRIPMDLEILTHRNRTVRDVPLIEIDTHGSRQQVGVFCGIVNGTLTKNQ
jgi:hypothetical protein